MDEASNGIGGHHTQKPKYDKDSHDSGEHRSEFLKESNNIRLIAHSELISLLSHSTQIVQGYILVID